MCLSVCVLVASKRARMHKLCVHIRDVNVCVRVCFCARARGGGKRERAREGGHVCVCVCVCGHSVRHTCFDTCPNFTTSAEFRPATSPCVILVNSLCFQWA